LAWLNFFLSGMQTAFGPIAAAGSAALFQLANASMMALLRGILAYEGKRQAAPLIAALIVAPQLLGGLLASWVGRSAEKHGRKPLLLVGFAPYQSARRCLL
jgi:MFS family permease